MNRITSEKLLNTQISQYFFFLNIDFEQKNKFQIYFKNRSTISNKNKFRNVDILKN